MLTHCLPAHQGWVSSGSQHSPFVCTVRAEELKDSFPGVSSPAGLSLTPMWKLPPVASLIQSSPPDGEVGEGSRGDLWRVSEHLYVTAVMGKGKGRRGTWETSGSWTGMGGRWGLKQEARLGGIIRSQSMQGLTNAIEFEPCFVSNGTFWTPLERPCIIVLIQLLSIFYIPRAALTTCYLFPTTANSMGSIIYPILQMRKLRNSEIKLAQGYSSIKWGSWVWNSNSSLNVYPICQHPWMDGLEWQAVGKQKPPSR